MLRRGFNKRLAECKGPHGGDGTIEDSTLPTWVPVDQRRILPYLPVAFPYDSFPLLTRYDGPPHRSGFRRTQCSGPIRCTLAVHAVCRGLLYQVRVKDLSSDRSGHCCVS